MQFNAILPEERKSYTMVRSMTGFGRAHEIIDGREYLVEIRSVNSRYYEFNSKLPRQYMYLEEKLKTLLKNEISRGKVEISLNVNNVEGKETQVTVNNIVVKSYIDELRKAGEKFGLQDDLKLSSIFEMTDAFNVLRCEADEDAIWNAVKAVTEAALAKFVAMREAEGEKMKADVLSKISNVEAMVSEVEKLSPETTAAYRKRLYDKLCEVLQSTQVDEQRILTEAAIFSEKVAVDEETVRLRSHFEQFRKMLSEENNVGRKLDFLTQELNRETNTIGSKAQDLRITRLVVDMKSEIEKIREQIQNIE